MTDKLRSRCSMAPVFVIAALFIVSNCSGQEYYIDSVGGDDLLNDGLTELTPWASHTMVTSVTLAPGDTVHFKRGSAFSGAIVISESGTAGNPITLTSYGTGDLPKFTNPSTSDQNGNAIRVGGAYTIVETLHFHDTPGEEVSLFIIMSRLGAVRIDRFSDHCIIRNNVFMKCGQGIVSAGEYTLITENYMDGPSYPLWTDWTPGQESS